MINDGPSIMKSVDGWYRDDTHDGSELLYILYMYIRHAS